jgi:hypothetical protein
MGDVSVYSNELTILKALYRPQLVDDLKKQQKCSISLEHHI